MTSRQTIRLVAIAASLVSTLWLIQIGAPGWAAVVAYMGGMWTSAFFRRIAEQMGVNLEDGE